MTTPETNKAIQDFATKVRAALADLTQEEIQDLTDGLEADLAERAADQGTAFGSAAGYANELRAAAGLSAGSSVGMSGGSSAGDSIDGAQVSKLRWVPITDQIAAWWQGKLNGNPLLAKTWSWLGNFRGFWWVLRGYAVFLLFSNFYWRTGLLPASKTQFVAMVGCLVASYILSRKFWGRNWFLKLVAFGGHALTVFATFAVFMGAYGWQDFQYEARYPGVNFVPGLSMNGQSVTNIFAYDKDGQRIPIVQLFDQSGQPLAVVQSGLTQNGLPITWGQNKAGDSLTLTPGAYNGLAPVWNAWPLLQTSKWPDSFKGKLPTTPLDSPVDSVPKLTLTTQDLLPAASPTATPSSTPAAGSAKPSAKPMASASPTRTPKQTAKSKK